MKTITLPKKFIFIEGETNPPYKKYNGWNKISYSQHTSFKDYTMGYVRDYILNMKSEDSGIFARFGSDCGNYINPYDNSKCELLSDEDIKILDTIKLKHCENSFFEYEILIDLEPFGLKETVLQGFSDKQVINQENVVDITDYKTLTIKTKKAFYESDDYQQLDVYGYGLEELGFKIGDVFVTGLGRSGNNVIKGDKNVLRLSGEIIKIPKVYNRKKAKGFLENITKSCIEISEYYEVYNKYFAKTLAD